MGVIWTIRDNEPLHEVIGTLDFATDKVVSIKYHNKAFMKFFTNKNMVEGLSYGDTVKASFEIKHNKIILHSLKPTKLQNDSNILLTGAINTVAADKVNKIYQYNLTLKNNQLIQLSPIYIQLNQKYRNRYTFEVSIRWAPLRDFNGNLIENKTKNRDKYKMGYVYTIQQILDDSYNTLYTTQYTSDRVASLAYIEHLHHNFEESVEEANRWHETYSSPFYDGAARDNYRDANDDCKRYIDLYEKAIEEHKAKYE